MRGTLVSGVTFAAWAQHYVSHARAPSSWVASSEFARTKMAASVIGMLTGQPLPSVLMSISRQCRESRVCEWSPSCPNVVGAHCGHDITDVELGCLSILAD